MAAEVRKEAKLGCIIANLTYSVEIRGIDLNSLSGVLQGLQWCPMKRSLIPSVVLRSVVFLS